MKSEKLGENTDKQSLAEFLKKTRQDKNLGLDKLSELTKIQVYHLQAIEAGEFEKLPPLVYRDGILKRLAKFLEVDENKILGIYKEENPPEAELSVKNALPTPKNFFYFVLTPKKLAWFGGGLFFILISWYLWYQLSFLIGAPTLVMEPKEDIATKDEVILVKGRTDSGIDLTINGENTYVDSSGNFEKSVKLAAGVNIIEVRAVNGFDKVTKIVRQIFKETPQ